MYTPTRSDAPILVVSDQVGDAALVKQLLDPEFATIQTSTNPDFFPFVFDTLLADVLVFAFNTLEKAQIKAEALYQRSQKAHLHRHRTVILCSIDEVWRAYELCRKALFDDYVQFWPMTHDSPRLRMSIHLALRELAAHKDSGPTAGQLAAQAHHSAPLEGMLSRHLAQGEVQIRNTLAAAARAEDQVGQALDGFSRRIADGSLSTLLDVRDAAGLGHAFNHFKHDELQAPLRAVRQSVAPLNDWASEFRAEIEPFLERMRSPDKTAERAKPTVLVVDDDDMQRKLIGNLLRGDNYHLLFAASGADALEQLSKLRPDLVLMDIGMPGLDGLETTRRLKAMPGLAQVPVIMITGHSEGSVVIDSLGAGATAFLVKPFSQATLVGKITRALRDVRPAA
jgi:CheY-like chemotaxis protein